MIKVIVVDDNSYQQQQIVKIINQIVGYQVITTAKDGVEAIRYLANSNNLPHVIILDIEMRPIDGVTTMDFISEHFSTIKVIGFSSHFKGHVISDMFACGAMGYLYKGEVIESAFSKQNEIPIYKTKEGRGLLEVALESVVHNIPYVDERMDFDINSRTHLMNERKLVKDGLSKKYKLTKKQKEIIGLNVLEVDYKAIANITNSSPRTVETTVNSLSRKFGVNKGKEGVMAFCMRFGASVIARLSD
jgi:DNA-binding NarL/FixJ family response regulator